MDIFFQDPDQVPLPPNEVRITELRAEPWSDKRRLKVYLEVTPFQKKPNGEVQVTNQAGEELANISIIETIDPRMEFTLHLRGGNVDGTLSVVATIFYLEEAPESDGEDQPDLSQRRRLVVDQASTRLELPALDS